jgi:serine/threonine protein kinase
MLSGTKLGRYQIKEKIGAGGMGEVYLANDERLDRSVALKVLLPEFCCDADRVQRFKLEAKAASALNHPSIITIHEIGEENDRLYIATEFVDGETLREIIENGELSLPETIKIAEQIADALAVAHEAGIVHRDIKPENLMIRRDGYVKILDFGLAKPIFLSKTSGTEDLTVQMVKTQPGMVMGSVRYMSPEQARGKPTDGRTDVWSLGVVLYEMLTGTNPFEGETISDSLAALIHVEPQPLEDIPEELQRIVRKALRKNAAERYQSIKDFALDLKDLRVQMERDSAEIHISRPTKTTSVKRHSTSENATLIHRTSSATNAIGGRDTDWTKTQVHSVSTEKKSPRFLPLGLLAAFVILVFGSVYFLSNLFIGSAPKFEAIQVSRLTETGNAHQAAIAPDGKLVSFVNIQNGRQSLIVRQAATGSAVEIVPANGDSLLQPTFSPDGDYIFYVSANKGIGTLYQISALGGERKKLVHDIDSNVTFAPDGKKLAFFRHNPNEGGDTIFIVNSDGSDLQPLIETKEIGFDKFTGIDWSPDGERMLIGVSRNASDSPKKVQIATVEIKDKQFRLLNGNSWQTANSFDWLKDNSGIVFLGKPSMSDTQQIWRMDFPGGEAHQITTDTSDYASLSLAADTNAIITTKADLISSFWSLLPKTNELKQLSGDSKTLIAQYGISYAPNGKLFYARKTGEEVNIYSMNEDGSGEKQITSGAKTNYEPVATPDGRYVVFSSNRNGAFNLWRIDADGNNPVRLTDTQNAYDSQIDVMPDSKTVLFTRQSSDGGKTSLMKVSIDGGEAAALIPDSAASDLMPRVTPDGKRIAFQTFHYDKDTSRFHTALKIAELGENQTVQSSEEIEFGLHHPIDWTTDGTALNYINRSSTDNVWSLSPKTKKETPLTTFNSGNIMAFTWSSDGKKLFIVRGIYNSDLVLIKDGTKI